MGKILPQFTEQLPRDINIDAGFGELHPDTHTVKWYEDKVGGLPEELQHLPLDLDESFGIPLTIRKKTLTQPKENFKMGNAIRRSYKTLKRYKKHY
jgi:hypothetical protein